MFKCYIYKIFIAISNWINKIFAESFLVQFFLRETNSQKIDEDTLFAKLINKVIIFMQKIAHKIKLDKLFENSIFAKPMIWLTIATFLIPFVPTMIALLLIAFTFMSLALKVLITPEFKLKYFKTSALSHS